MSHTPRREYCPFCRCEQELRGRRAEDLKQAVLGFVGRDRRTAPRLTTLALPLAGQCTVCGTPIRATLLRRAS